MFLSGVKRSLRHRILRFQSKSYRVNKLQEKLNALKKEEKKVLTNLGYSVYARGDASKYGRSGSDLLMIEKDMSVVEDLLYAQERKMKY